MQYFNRKWNGKVSQRLNEYESKVQKLEHEKYLLKQEIEESKSMVQTLRGANKTLYNALKIS